MVEEIIWLSKVAYEKLSKELEHRQGDLRKDITQRIADARAEGDLKENGGYHAARDEQGKNEAKIKELQYRLEHARVGLPANAGSGSGSGGGDAGSGSGARGGTIIPGMLVVAELNNSGSPIKFILGSRENADEELGIDAFSPSSPLGTAILGAKAGDTREYKAPNGKSIVVKIISVD
jgi:transcription elongation factor GreA